MLSKKQLLVRSWWYLERRAMDSYRGRYSQATVAMSVRVGLSSMEENQAAARELKSLQGWRLPRSRHGDVVARAISRQDQRWARPRRERKGQVRQHTHAMAGGWNFGLLRSLEKLSTYSCYP